MSDPRVSSKEGGIVLSPRARSGLSSSRARYSLRGFAVLVCMAAVGLFSAASAQAVTGAAFTTVNETADGTGHCQNGNPNNNCNIYDGKEFVWLNGGPSVAYVGDGTYFFAVLAPGGQPSPNDASSIPDDATGTPKNLSDDFDAYTNRTFTVTDGTVSYSGSHEFKNNKIRLADYTDTPNPGGVYIMAICSLGDGDDYPVTPSKCKYDAFKVLAGDEEEVTPGAALTADKTADGSADRTFGWTIAKTVNKTVVKQVGGSATFTYTVTAAHTVGTLGNVKVTGVITVTNPNTDAVTIDGITDQLSDGTVCAITDGGPQTLATGETKLNYSCDLSAVTAGLDNS